MGAGKSMKVLSLENLSFQHHWLAESEEGDEAPSPPVVPCLSKCIVIEKFPGSKMCS